MKTNKFLLIGALAAISTVFTACSDDDDASFTIAGSYPGIYTESRLGDFDNATTVEDNGDGTYNLVAPSFYLQGKGDQTIDYGAMRLKNITLEKDEATGNYTLSGEWFGVKIDYSYNEATRKDPTILEFSAHLNGTLSANGKLDYTLDLNHANTVLFYFTFNGKK